MHTDHLKEHDSLKAKDEKGETHHKHSHNHPKHKTAEALDDDQWRKHPGGG